MYSKSFDRNIWISSNRDTVDKKFEYAMNEMNALMSSGAIAVRKAKDVFGESAFSDYGGMLGMGTYKFDPLRGEMKILSYGRILLLQYGFFGRLRYLRDRGCRRRSQNAVAVMKHVILIISVAVVSLLIIIINIEILLFGGKILYDEDPKPRRKREYKSNLILWGVFMICFIAFILLKHVFKII